MYFHISLLRDIIRLTSHISVDGSGSMSGTKWDKAITSTVAMCKAADMAGNIRVIVSFRFTQKDKPLVLIGYDSNDKQTKSHQVFVDWHWCCVELP